MRPHRIVDTHQHFWDLSANYYPWLSDKIVRKPYGNYASIRRNYLKVDLSNDIGSLPVVKSVHVDAGHDPGDPTRETRWLQQLAADTTVLSGFPQGIVVRVNLSSENAASLLEAHCAFPNVRGVRGMLSDSVRYPGQHPDLLQDATWRRNVGLLTKHGLSLDLQLYPSQMPAVAELARKWPGIQFIICHTGMPTNESGQSEALWHEGLRRLAAAPNVALKISGFGMMDQRWTNESVKPLILAAIGAFGPDRCMFGSNFPVDRLFSDYRRIWESYIDATADLSEEAVDAVYYGTANRLYRL